MGGIIERWSPNLRATNFKSTARKPMKREERDNIKKREDVIALIFKLIITMHFELL